MARKYTDNALTTLASSINNVATTLSVAAGKGDNFPAITGKGAAGSAIDYFVITLEDAAGNREKIKVEHRAAGSDAMGSGGYPLIRGYDGTAARSWVAGDSVDLRIDDSALQDYEDKVQAGAVGRAFGVKPSTTNGLTLGYYGGVVLVDGVLTNVADDTVVLTGSQTNYVERTKAGVVSANIVGFSADKQPLHTIITDASGITSITDARGGIEYSGKLTKSVAGGANVTLSAAECRNEIIELTGVLTADISVIFPALKRMWLIHNATSGGYSVTAKVNGQPGVVLGADSREIVFGNGTDIEQATPGVPVGTMLDMPFTGVEPGYLECDGSNQTRTASPRLFRKLMKSATVTFTSGTDLVGWTKHGLSAGDVFKFYTTGAAPAGLTASVAGGATTTYFVINPTTNDFQLAATEGGAAINFTTDGTGTHTGIHAPFGDGNGTTTYTLPDSRRRITVGRGGAATTALGARLGASGGEETHTQTVAEMATHAHGVTDPTHTHTYQDPLGGAGADAFGGNPSVGTQNTGASATGISIQNSGSSTPFNVRDPSLVVTKMIKV